MIIIISAQESTRWSLDQFTMTLFKYYLNDKKLHGLIQIFNFMEIKSAYYLVLIGSSVVIKELFPLLDRLAAYKDNS